MTKEELKQKREALGLEVLELVDAIGQKVREYAELIGEKRPLVASMNIRLSNNQASANSYVDLSYLQDECGMTEEESHKVPQLFSVCRVDGFPIDHRLIRSEKYLGEGEEE